MGMKAKSLACKTLIPQFKSGGAAPAPVALTVTKQADVMR